MEHPVSFPETMDSWRNLNALCKTYNTEFIIDHGVDNDVKKHLVLKKHLESVKVITLKSS